MFISAYSPLFAIFAIRDFDFECSHQLMHPLAVYTMLGIVALSIVTLFASLGVLKEHDMRITVTMVKNRSTDLFNYSILYVICFFAIDLSKWGDFLSMAFFLLLMLWLTVTTNSVFLNPILSLAGYGLYDVEYEFDGGPGSTTVLTKIQLNTNTSYAVTNISRYLYFIR